jgi:hypothetical protein
VAPFFGAAKNIRSVSFGADSKGRAKAFAKHKNSRSAVQAQSIESGLWVP